MKILREQFLRIAAFLAPAIGDNESRKSLMQLNLKHRDGKAIFTAASSFIIKGQR